MYSLKHLSTQTQMNERHNFALWEYKQDGIKDCLAVVKSCPFMLALPNDVNVSL